MHRPQPHAAAVVRENRRHYELLVEVAERYAAQGDVEHLLRAATVAANYAWLAPVGMLADLRLERAIVHAVRGPGRVTVDGDRRTGRVLHVLSEAYSVGGHTRLAWRWMSRDEHASDVVLINQQGPVPDQLVESVRAKGGDVHDLAPTARGLLDRARALRAHMDRADLVVLHVHPYDAVAFAAVNLPGVRPPVIYENHTDQSFWLGVAGAELLCDLRAETRAIDEALRGVPDERIVVLPMPVDQLTSGDDDALRRRLGIRPDAVVALTVSADWKMAACWGRGMHHAVERVLHWSPQVSVVLVGGSPNPDWARLSKRYPGRVFPVGRVLDPAPYFALTDIYLESYPVRSTTAALEAAVLGLPVVTLDDLPVDDLVYLLQASSPGLAGRSVATTIDKFAVAVRRLAADPDLRRREGEAVRTAVLAVHDGDGWRSRLAALYERARALPAVDVDDLAQPREDERFAAMLISAMSAPVSPDPRSLAGPLGDLFDPTLEMDLLAALHRDRSASFQVRVAPNWQDVAEPMTRLLGLASAHRRMTVSLPFVPDDDAQGTLSVAHLTGLLATLGQTTDDCGDIRLESTPRPADLSLNGELQLSEDALDRLEAFASSPLWEGRPVSAVPAEPQPVGV